MADLSNHAVRGYSLGECVGRGGSGAVYRAYQSGIEREVAIKVILPEYANQPEFIRRFEVEARLIAQLEHPHIVPLYDFWRDPDGAYLVMRWLPRGLRSVVGNGRYWSVDAAIKLLDQIGGALIAAHRKGIIHRDIKPDNILLDSEGNAYLADFGIAKNLNATNNSSGNFRGTPAYVAPEQIKGEMLDPRTDIYLLGLVLYELLVGEKPYGDDASPATLLIKHLTDPLPRLSAMRSDLPRALNEVLQTATQKEAAQRYADVSAMLLALHQATGENVAPAIPGTEELTVREREIIELLAQGLSASEMAEKLVMTVSTIRWYLRQIYSKLDVHTRPQAIDRARQLVRQWTEAANPSAGAKSRSNATERSLFAPITNAAQIAVENPYKGLRAFQEADSEDFFGRSRLVDRLLERLNEKENGAMSANGSTTTRFLAVVGPSGSGKSSVVLAGLLPRLRDGSVRGAEKWFVATMFPGAYPLEELEAALSSVAINPPSDLLSQLRQDSRGLLRVIKRILPRDEETELLLVIDQFEEVFTLVEEEAERAHFLDSLRLALSDPRSRLRVIVTLRADFFDKPMQYFQFVELMRQRIEFVPPLSPDELREAIVGPAERKGLKVESALVATIVADVSEQPGALPLLQFALMELFDHREGRKLTLTAYRASGGVAGALARRADELYESLNEQGQEAARQLFLRLIALGDVDNTRRRVSRSELATLVEQPGFLDAVIEAYNQYRLLTLDRDPATRMPTVEVAHEAVIRSWDRLRGWIEQAHDDLRAQRQLAQSAAEWAASQYDQSFLATGARLGRFESMVASGIIAVNEEERRYFEASIAHRDHLLAVETQQREHEAELTRQAIESAEAAQNNLLQSECMRLAAESSALLGQPSEQTELAALLALRSLTIEYSAQADQSLLRANNRGYPSKVLNIDPQQIMSVAFSYNSQLLIVGSRIGHVYVWDVATGIQLFCLKAHSSHVYGLCATDNILVTGGLDNTMCIWDLSSGVLQKQIAMSSNVAVFEMSSDKRLILVGGLGYAGIWDMETLHEKQQLWVDKTESTYYADAAISADDRNIATGTPAGISVWDTRSGNTITSIKIPSSTWICGLRFSLDGNYLFCVLDNSTVLKWSVGTGELIEQYKLHGEPNLKSVKFATFEDGCRLLGIDETGVCIWDLETGARADNRRYSALSPAASIANDSTLIAIAGVISTAVRVWDRTNPTMKPTLYELGHNFGVIPFANGEIIAVWSSRVPTIRIIDLQTKIELVTLHNTKIWTLLFEDEAKRIFSINSSQTTITLYDIQQQQPHRTFPVRGILNWWSANATGSLLIIGMTGHIDLFDVEEEKLVRSIFIENVMFGGIQFIDDNVVWYIPSPYQLCILNLTPDISAPEVYDLKANLRWTILAPNKDLLVLCTDEGIDLLDLNSKKMSTFLKGGEAAFLNYATFSSDGRYLVGYRDDNAVYVWSFATAQLIRVIMPSEDHQTYTTCWVMPDNKRFRMLSGGVIREYSFDYREDVEIALKHFPRDLTEQEREKFGITDPTPTRELTFRSLI